MMCGCSADAGGGEVGDGDGEVTSDEAATVGVGGGEITTDDTADSDGEVTTDEEVLCFGEVTTEQVDGFGKVTEVAGFGGEVTVDAETLTDADVIDSFVIWLVTVCTCEFGSARHATGGMQHSCSTDFMDLAYRHAPHVRDKIDCFAPTGRTIPAA